MKTHFAACHRFARVWKHHRARPLQQQKHAFSWTARTPTLLLSNKFLEPVDWFRVEAKANAKNSEVDELKSFDYSLEPGLDRSIEYFTTEYGLEDPDRETLQPVEDFLRFFFSDCHARENRELRENFLLVGDGSFPIRILLQNREMTDLGLTSPHVITKVVKDFCSDALEVTPDGTAVRRIIPFNIANLHDNIPKTLIVWNLPRDELLGEYLVTRDELQLLFQGDVIYTKFRFRSPTPDDRVKRGKIPTGVATLEFRTIEECQMNAQQYLTYREGKSVSPSKELRLQEHILQVCFMKEYLASRR